MSQTLTFNEISFTPITHQNSLWIRAAELARALGYSSENLVSRIYRRNAEEFTEDMTQVIEISAEDQSGLLNNLSAGRCRIFSLRGCHLLAMFARTPVAKAFRKWVLDVLDRLAAEERAALPEVPTGSILTPAHRSELKAIVDAKLSTYPSSVQGKARSEIWARFNRNFKIAEYAQLPAEHMAEARDYLIELEVKALKKLPQATAPDMPQMEIATRADDIDGHLAAIKEHVRRIRDHEDAIFLAARKAMPLRGVGPSISLASLIHRNMENAAWSLHYALESMEASARIVVVAGRG